MKKHYIGLWLLLAVAFAAFAALSALDEITLGPVSLKSSGIAERLLKPVDTVVETTSQQAPPTLVGAPAGSATAIVQNHAGGSAATDSATVATPYPDSDDGSEPTTAVAPQYTPTTFPAPADTAAKTILLLGDSMLEGLSPRLADYAAKNGHTLYSVIWYSSTSAVWGKSERLKDYIQRLKPDFIFISLGANELFVNDIKNKRRDFVRKIVADVDTIPFVWIGPPNWKDDTGINELISENVPRGCYFRSAGMHFDRAKDGAHPTRTSAARWMDSIARWMPGHAAHPILMEHPGDIKGKPKRIFVHQPNEK